MGLVQMRGIISGPSSIKYIECSQCERMKFTRNHPCGLDLIPTSLERKVGQTSNILKDLRLFIVSLTNSLPAFKGLTLCYDGRAVNIFQNLYCLTTFQFIQFKYSKGFYTAMRVINVESLVQLAHNAFPL